MTNDTEIDYAAMSGEDAYRKSRLLELNEVSLNGDGDVAELEPGKFERKGGFFRKRVLVGRKSRDEKPEEINLGASVSVVFLKIRRRMIERAEKGEIVLSTVEHDSPYSRITLFENATKRSEAGVARDIRERYKGLRTTQVVYALLLAEGGEPELVRLMVRGSSLGSEAKAPEVMSFYDYVASFPKGAHMWQFKTELNRVLEQGAKAYFAIDFKRGEPLDEATLGLAKAKLKEVYDNCVEVDEARETRAAAEAAAKPADAGAADGMAAFDSVVDTGEVEPPPADINPDDIPF